MRSGRSLGSALPGSKSECKPPVSLTNDHRVAAFDCADETLNRWLKERGHRSEGRTSRSYVVCDEDGRVAKYYCLAVGRLPRTYAPETIRHNAPRCDTDHRPWQARRGPALSRSAPSTSLLETVKLTPIYLNRDLADRPGYTGCSWNQCLPFTVTSNLHSLQREHNCSSQPVICVWAFN